MQTQLRVQSPPQKKTAQNKQKIQCKLILQFMEHLFVRQLSFFESWQAYLLPNLLPSET